MNKMIIAITGPSGVGKSTLSDKLVKNDGFVVPTHTTTRSPRSDDVVGFYRYLSHDEFKNDVILNKFLYWSGDSNVIDKKYGNYYGMLKSDYHDVSKNDKIVIFISYKDIDSILYLKSIGYNIEVVNLLYYDIDENMIIRLSDASRNHSEEDIKRRIECAKSYEELFRQKLDGYNVLKIYTDLCDEEETYNIVKKKKIKWGK